MERDQQPSPTSISPSLDSSAAPNDLSSNNQVNINHAAPLLQQSGTVPAPNINLKSPRADMKTTTNSTSQPSHQPQNQYYQQPESPTSSISSSAQNSKSTHANTTSSASSASNQNSSSKTPAPSSTTGPKSYQSNQSTSSSKSGGNTSYTYATNNNNHQNIYSQYFHYFNIPQSSSTSSATQQPTSPTTSYNHHQSYSGHHYHSSSSHNASHHGSHSQHHSHHGNNNSGSHYNSSSGQFFHGHHDKFNQFYMYSFLYNQTHPDDIMLILEDPYDSNKITVQLTRTHTTVTGEEQRITIERDFKNEQELNKFLKEFEQNVNKPTTTQSTNKSGYTKGASHQHTKASAADCSKSRSSSFSNMFQNGPRFKSQDLIKSPGYIVVEEPGEEPLLYRQDTGELITKGPFVDPFLSENLFETMFNSKSATNGSHSHTKFYKDMDDLVESIKKNGFAAFNEATYEVRNDFMKRGGAEKPSKAETRSEEKSNSAQKQHSSEDRRSNDHHTDSLHDDTKNSSNKVFNSSVGQNSFKKLSRRDLKDMKIPRYRSSSIRSTSRRFKYQVVNDKDTFKKHSNSKLSTKTSSSSTGAGSSSHPVKKVVITRKAPPTISMSKSVSTSVNPPKPVTVEKVSTPKMNNGNISVSVNVSTKPAVAATKDQVKTNNSSNPVVSGHIKVHAGSSQTSGKISSEPSQQNNHASSSKRHSNLIAPNVSTKSSHIAKSESSSTMLKSCIDDKKSMGQKASHSNYQSVSRHANPSHRLSFREKKEPGTASRASTNRYSLIYPIESEMPEIPQPRTPQNTRKSNQLHTRLSSSSQLNKKLSQSVDSGLCNSSSVINGYYKSGVSSKRRVCDKVDEEEAEKSVETTTCSNKASVHRVRKEAVDECHAKVAEEKRKSSMSMATSKQQDSKSGMNQFVIENNDYESDEDNEQVVETEVEDDDDDDEEEEDEDYSQYFANEFTLIESATSQQKTPQNINYEYYDYDSSKASTTYDTASQHPHYYSYAANSNTTNNNSTSTTNQSANRAQTPAFFQTGAANYYPRSSTRSKLNTSNNIQHSSTTTTNSNNNRNSYQYGGYYAKHGAGAGGYFSRQSGYYSSWYGSVPSLDITTTGNCVASGSNAPTGGRHYHNHTPHQHHNYHHEHRQSTFYN